MDSPFPWPGGKRSLKKILLQLIPQHRAYVEVFAGSAKLLFAKDPSRWEVLNDVNDELLTFFRVVKHRPAELAEMMEREFIGKARFAELRARTKMECEIEKALRFLYLVWFSFGGMGETFARHTLKMPRPVKRSLTIVREVLHQTAERLAHVLVDRRDFAECIDRYDSRDTFFYLDPPYTVFQANGRYEPLGEDRLRELFTMLRKIKGKFLLSFDDAPVVRELSRGLCVKPVSVLYSLAANSKKQAPELLISNYPLTPQK
jgi:DNA adenine methylase